MKTRKKSLFIIIMLCVVLAESSTASLQARAEKGDCTMTSVKEKQGSIIEFVSHVSYRTVYDTTLLTKDGIQQMIGTVIHNNTNMERKPQIEVVYTYVNETLIGIKCNIIDTSSFYMEQFPKSNINIIN